MFSYIGETWDSNIRTKKMAMGVSDFVPQSQQFCITSCLGSPVQVALSTCTSSSMLTKKLEKQKTIDKQS